MSELESTSQIANLKKDLYLLGANSEAQRRIQYYFESKMGWDMNVVRL